METPWTTSFLKSVSDFWTEQTEIISINNTESISIFGISEFLASYALLFVVLTTSDYLHHYRLALLRWPVYRLGFWMGFGVGFLLLAIDWWYANEWPVLRMLSNPNHMRFMLASLFLIFVALLVRGIFVTPTRFTKYNAKYFFAVHHHIIMEGNKQRLAIVAEELIESLEDIGKVGNYRYRIADVAMHPKLQKRKELSQTAQDLIFLFANRRFCNVIARQVPQFAVSLVTVCQDHDIINSNIDIFNRNVGLELLANQDSALYHEINALESGLTGMTRPVSNTIFGCYRLIEGSQQSPLDVETDEFLKFNLKQLEAYVRASGIFMRAYANHFNGHEPARSSSVLKLLFRFNSICEELSYADRCDPIVKHQNFQKFQFAVRFLKETIQIFDQSQIHLKMKRPQSDPKSKTLVDDISHFTLNMLFYTASIKYPPDSAWQVQYHEFLQPIFGSSSKTADLIAFQVRRLIFDEMRALEVTPKIETAVIIGFLLNALGVEQLDRKLLTDRSLYSIHKLLLDWLKENYRSLWAEHQEIAEAMIVGAVSYDETKNQIIKTFSDDNELSLIKHRLQLN